MEVTPAAEDLLDQYRTLVASGDDAALARWVEEVRPQQILEYWDELEEDERTRLLDQLGPQKAAELVANLPAEELTRIFEGMPAPEVRDLLEELEPDDLADALQVLEAHDPEHADSVASLLDPEIRAQAEALARYEVDEAGGLMTPEFISLRASMTVEQVLNFLRRASPDAETIYYLYVVDDESKLLGVLTLRQLIVATPETRIRDIMEPDVVRITTDTDQEKVAQIMADYDFAVLPVVDSQNRLVGIVTVDDVLDVVEDEATEDILRLGAAPIDIDYPRAQPWLLFRKRAPWLVALVISMTLTVQVLSDYEDLLSEITLLSFFLPLLIGTGGNVGAQAATLVVRSLATRELELRDYLRVLYKELGTGLLLGLGFGAFTACYVLLMMRLSPDRFEGESMIALALGITMLLISVTANLVGASLPFVFRRFGIDPALTSSPGITTVMDVLGLLIYFRVVIWVLY